jgi:hypothetical protein
MKKFLITVPLKREFEVPDNATDEEYDSLKEVALAGMMANPDIDRDDAKVELIDAPDAIKQKYIINPDAVD